MNKFIYFTFLFLTIIKISNALEMSCLFEEVHSDGSIQQGMFLIKDDKFRYQYDSKNLFTIIHTQKIFLLIENSDTTRFIKIDQNIEMLENISLIFQDYPDFKGNYHMDNALIKVELSEKNIVKRIALLSEGKNLSIYLNDCEFIPIKDIYFSYSPLFEYK